MKFLKYANNDELSCNAENANHFWVIRKQTFNAYSLFEIKSLYYPHDMNFYFDGIDIAFSLSTYN